MESLQPTSSSSSCSGESSPFKSERGRTRSRGRGRGRARGGARSESAGRGRASSRGRSRSVRTRGRTSSGRRSVRQAAEERAQEAVGQVQAAEEQIKVEIEGMNEGQLRNLCLEMVRRHPGLIFDIMKPSERQPGGFHPPPGAVVPDWCVCGKCRQMPTEAERRCCQKQQCVSLLPDFQVLVLNEAVLALGRLYRRDILVYDDEADMNKANRHQAYRQFTLWRHGMLGAGDRRVIPSCCAWTIRDKFPDPFAQYKGFIPSRLE